MIRVFVTDDHEIVREGLKRMVADTDDMVVCGDAASGEELLSRVGTEGWDVDVLVLDINLPRINGLEVIQRLSAMKPEIKIVAFTMYDEASHALRVMRAGARGFLSKTRPPIEVLDAIRKVYSGGRYVTSALAEYMFEKDIDLKKEPHQTMSDREYEIFMLLGKGKKPKEIAEQLAVSYSTITTYVYRIKNKLSVTSIGEIVQYAFRHKLID
jgi:two-component system, NarL family, invasion response regulator UvrY